MSLKPVLPIACVALTFALGSAALASEKRYDRVNREAFNRAAVRLDVPIYWAVDENADGAIDPSEVATLLFYPSAPRWTENGHFTKAFANAYDDIVAWAGDPPLPSSLSPDERERRRLVIEDLDQGRPTLVQSDFRDADPRDRVLVGHMLRVAKLIDALYARQIGIANLQAQIPAGDAASQSLFRRNWGARCVAPATEANPACTAVPGAPRPGHDAYPAAWQAEENLCARLEASSDDAALSAPFTVVREREGHLVALPVTEVYKEQTSALAAELRASAADTTAPSEDALRAYLTAAAHGFETNDWEPADEAWARMNVHNSRWYVRVAPDEVYRDPCRLKAGFHLTFARINKDSLAWQDKLAPYQQQMEHEVAALAGQPYAERQVTFHLPDFIDIVVNAGDDRAPLGATIGQSLPNWGPVANQGRGRTVAMSNLYTDPDSLRLKRTGAASLLDAPSLGLVSDDPAPGLLNTILHEAAHNLGPSHEYRVDGKVDRDVFGGPLATTMEELKAQTLGVWLIDFLRAQGVIDQSLAQRAYVNAVTWAMGHIASGMYQGGDVTRPKPYSQLAAIQIGFLMDQGAIEWKPDVLAANATDKGAFVLHLDRFPTAMDALARQVAGVKARGDRAAAEAMVHKYVEGDTERHAVIADRLLRLPKASFVYAVEM